MGRVNLLSLPGAQYRSLTKTYTDPHAPGVELTLTLRSLINTDGQPDQFRVALALERAEAFYQKFAETGFAFPDGEMIPISKPLAETLCYLEVRLDGPEEQQYTHEQLLGLVRSMPTAYQQVAADCEELDAGLKEALAETPEGNA